PREPAADRRPGRHARTEPPPGSARRAPADSEESASWLHFRTYRGPVRSGGDRSPLAIRRLWRGVARPARLADFGHLAYRRSGQFTGHSSVTTRLGGKATSISVPARGTRLMLKIARLASASALVSGRPMALPAGA